MTEYSSETGEIVRYLLGDATEEERQRVERAYFTDETTYRRLLEIEDDLAGSWARGELTASQREHFGRRLLASETGRARAEFAEALLRVSQRREAATISQGIRRAHRILLWLPAAAAVAMAVAGGIEIRLLENRVSALRAQIEAGRTHAAGAPAQPLLSFLLSPGLTRGPEGLRRFAIPAGSGSVRFQLEVPAGHLAGPLTARLVLADGREVWSGLAAAGDQAAEVVVPREVLAPEEYDLLVEPMRRAGNGLSYHFAVSRR